MKSILFDLDGTVIDSTEAILESFHNSFEVYKLPQPSDEEIKALIGHPLDGMYRDLGVQEEIIWDMVTTYKAHYVKIYKDKTILLEHAREAIELAGEFARLGIVTTKTGKYSQELLEYFGIMDSFEVLVGREHVEHPKPHAEPILKALDSMKVERNNAWMIGDTNMDVLSAKNAGIKSIAVTSGYESREQLSEVTDIIEEDVLEAVKYIQAH